MTKQISVADDVYESLANLRRPDESFSDVLRRWSQAARREAMLAAIGSWKMTDDEAERMLAEIHASRRTSRPRKVPDL